jgi:hypothetical protein
MKSFHLKLLVTLAIVLIYHRNTNAAGNKDYKAFCSIMSKLIESADQHFENIMGPLKDSSEGVKTWKSKIDFPGVVTSSVKDEVVVSRYYRGDFKSVKKEAIQVQYDKYLKFLDQCMTAKGYKIQKMPNEKGTSDFDDIIYRLPDDSPIPIEKRPFIRMTVNYNDVENLYNISIYVNENFL